MRTKHATWQSESDAVVSFPGADKLTAEQALRASIDSHVFASLHELTSQHGGRAVQAVYAVLLRRLPNVHPDRKRIAIDSGHSESSVKRAIALLEKCGLIKVNRQRGKRSDYLITDLRHADHVSRCLTAIRALRNGRTNSGRPTSDPTPKTRRAICDPGSQVTGELRVGPLVNQKEAKKKQKKQQDAGAARSMKKSPITKHRFQTDVLEKWGLSEANYLVMPGHPKAIPELVSAGISASELIELTMRSTQWSPGAGTWARVAYLRDHVQDSVRELEHQAQQRQAKHQATERRAKIAMSRLKAHQSKHQGGLDTETQQSLAKRALKRLNESPEVIEHLRQDPAACEMLANSERQWDEIAQRIDSSSNSQFVALCERLFAQKPGIRRFYENTARDNPLLRAQLIEMLYEEKSE